MKKNISYDKRFDIVFVHKGFGPAEKFGGNLIVGDLVLDISSKGRVRGIEILNATEFLKEFHITEDVLESLDDVAFIATTTPTGIILSISFNLKKSAQPISAMIAVPLEVPLITS